VNYSTGNSRAIPREMAGGINLTYHGFPHMAVNAGVAPETRFGERNVRYTTGASVMMSRTSLAAQMSWRGLDTRFSAHTDASAEVLQRFRQFSAGAGFRQITFSDSRAQIPAAILDWQVTSTVELEMRFAPSRVDTSDDTGWRQGGMSRVTWNATPWLAPFASFAVGSTASGVLVNNHIDYFAAQAYTGGARLRVSPRHFFHAYYTRENRSGDIVAHEFGTGFTVVF